MKDLGQHLFAILLAALMLACGNEDRNNLKYEIDLNTVRSGYNPDTMWTQVYTAAVPNTNQVLITMSQRLSGGIDNYGGLYYCLSNDKGQSWSEPSLVMERTVINDSMEMVLSDVYPQYHRQSGKILSTGKLFYYLPERAEDPEVSREAGYTVYNPETEQWSELKTLELPAKDHSGAPIFNPSAGCNQRIDLDNGEILLPVYYLRDEVADGLNVTTIARCSFDGKNLKYIEHGDELTIDSGRGLGETSITKFKDEYFITMRADHSAFVAKGKDGLHFESLQEWRFDDDSLLGSYNTQQHWVTHGDALFLVYTRRGANNDHVFRHRAPLFMAQVDPEKLQVIRETEQVLVPEKGARLGNFGVTDIDENMSAVSVSERMEAKSAQYGSDNRVYFSRILWEKPNELIR